MNRKIFSILLIMLILLLGFAVTLEPSLAKKSDAIFAGFGTAIIDGQFTQGEWDNSGIVSFEANTPEGTSPAIFAVMNDETNLYLAVSVDRPSQDAYTHLSIHFDNDNDGIAEHGDDYIFVYSNQYGSGFGDVFWSDTQNPPSLTFYDTQYGGTTDGSGDVGFNGASTILEMSHPLDSLDDEHDFSLQEGDLVGVFYLRLYLSNPAGNTYTYLYDQEISIAYEDTAGGPNQSCDGLLRALEQIPPGSPGYESVLEMAQANCSEAVEHAALVELYLSTNGENWVTNTNWLDENIHHCNWYKVTCDSDNIVTEINLLSNNLTGILPPELGNFKNLYWLRLYNNHLAGSIPPQLGNLEKLDTLMLNGNQLTSSIPSSLGNLTNLRNLTLDNNQLSGSIPIELGNLSNLKFLYLRRNQLSGSIPPELGNLSNLTQLHLSYNQLTGWIPTELGQLTNLWWLSLYFNQLSGPIPQDLGNLTSLSRLDLGLNNLTGTIPPELGNLINLHTLYLPSNQLSGTIPKKLGNLTNLKNLYLASNQLSGTIPEELGDLTNLQNLNLSANQLTGCIPTELSNLSSLYTLWLVRNSFSGWESQVALDWALSLNYYFGPTNVAETCP